MTFREDRISEQNGTKLRDGTKVQHPMTEGLVSTPADSDTRAAPTVSFNVPAYNTAAYISEALDSVFPQIF
jgi:hypothetical protein